MPTVVNQPIQLSNFVSAWNVREKESCLNPVQCLLKVLLPSSSFFTQCKIQVYTQFVWLLMRARLFFYTYDLVSYRQQSLIPIALGWVLIWFNRVCNEKCTRVCVCVWLLPFAVAAAAGAAQLRWWAHTRTHSLYIHCAFAHRGDNQNIYTRIYMKDMHIGSCGSPPSHPPA